jgi:hypothetical protein
MTKKMLMAVACLGAAVASAQTMSTVRVNLPEGTKVGKVSLPAGEYSIHELNNSVLEIKSESHQGVNAFVTANTVETKDGIAANHTKVVLKKEGDGYQIQTIWLEGQDLGFELTAAE